MTIQQAIKSGIVFRRKGWIEWIDIRSYGGDFFFQTSKKRLRLTMADILAEDWEVKERHPVESNQSE